MLATLFGGSSSATLDIAIDQQTKRRTCHLNPREPSKGRAYIYSTGDDISGTAIAGVRPGRKVDHLGIKVELIGETAPLKDGVPSAGGMSFLRICKDLEPPGTLYQAKSFRWKFAAVDLCHDTYWGINIRLRYFVRVSLAKRYGSNTSQECDFVVQNCDEDPIPGPPIKMEVGIEDCLHIEFEYNKCAYHLRDVVLGRVYFSLVRIKIKYMELNILRLESVRQPGAPPPQTEIVARFEIMDGTAIKSEYIPVRLYLAGYDLTPSFRNVQNQFSVKYMLNLILVDEEERRYFKKQEISLYRRPASTVSQHQHQQPPKCNDLNVMPAVS